VAGFRLCKGSLANLGRRCGPPGGCKIAGNDASACCCLQCGWLSLLLLAARAPCSCSRWGEFHGRCCCCFCCSVDMPATEAAAAAAVYEAALHKPCGYSQRRWALGRCGAQTVSWTHRCEAQPSRSKAAISRIVRACCLRICIVLRCLTTEPGLKGARQLSRSTAWFTGSRKTHKRVQMKHLTQITRVEGW
jgi:hypothetical protein